MIRLLAALDFAPPLHKEVWYKIVIKRYQRTYKVTLRILLSESKTGMPHGRPDSTKICGKSISVQLTTCHEQTKLLKRFTTVLSRCCRCQSQISGNSSKPSGDVNPCRPSLCLSCSWERECTRGRKRTLGLKNA